MNLKNLTEGLGNSNRMYKNSNQILNTNFDQSFKTRKNISSTPSKREKNDPNFLSEKLNAKIIFKKENTRPLSSYTTSVPVKTENSNSKKMYKYFHSNTITNVFLNKESETNNKINFNNNKNNINVIKKVENYNATTIIKKVKINIY
jgi:hypothetical protein